MRRKGSLIAKQIDNEFRKQKEEKERAERIKELNEKRKEK